MKINSRQTIKTNYGLKTVFCESPSTLFKKGHL